MECVVELFHRKNGSLLRRKMSGLGETMQRTVGSVQHECEKNGW